MSKLLTQQDLAERWQCDIRSVENKRKQGILVPCKNVPGIRFTEQHILELEGIKLDKMSPLERRRLEKEISELQLEIERLNKEKEQLKGIIANVLAETSQVFNLKREAS